MFATLALLVCVSPQAPAPDSKPTAQPVEAAASVRKLSNDEARTLLASFKKDYKRSAKLAPKMRAVSALAEGSHPTFVKPLAQVVRKESTMTVRRTAAKALGSQPAKQLRAPLMKLLGDKSIQKQPAIALDLIEALDKQCYKKGKDWKLLDKLFESDFSEKHRPKQRAILVLAKNHKEVDAIPLLLRHLDEPGPEGDIDAAGNPPAEYWEARWKSWRAWKTEVKGALYEITGQQFNASKEAHAWIRKNRSKLGR